MDAEALKALLKSVANGKLSLTSALEKLKFLTFEPVEDFARIDHDRQTRTGFPEVIWGLGKTPEQILKIIHVMAQNHAMVMATRIEPEVYQQLRAEIPDLTYYSMAKSVPCDRRVTRTMATSIEALLLF